jgi:hypothetical protein
LRWEVHDVQADKGTAKEDIIHVASEPNANSPDL